MQFIWWFCMCLPPPLSEQARKKSMLWMCHFMALGTAKKLTIVLPKRVCRGTVAAVASLHLISVNLCDTIWASRFAFSLYTESFNHLFIDCYRTNSHCPLVSEKWKKILLLRVAYGCRSNVCNGHPEQCVWSVMCEENNQLSMTKSGSCEADLHKTNSFFSL